MNLKHRADIIGNTIELVDKRRFYRDLARYDGKLVDITISPVKKPRSDKENRYYWGVALAMLSQETGQDTETLHEVCKTKFLLHSVKINEEYVMVGRSTTGLSTVEFEKYLEDVRRWASEFLGLYIPLPNEVIF